MIGFIFNAFISSMKNVNSFEDFYEKIESLETEYKYLYFRKNKRKAFFTNHTAVLQFATVERYAPKCTSKDVVLTIITKEQRITKTLNKDNFISLSFNRNSLNLSTKNYTINCSKNE